MMWRRFGIGSLKRTVAMSWGNDWLGVVMTELNWATDKPLLR